MEIVFYQLTTSSLEKFLPKILEKIYKNNTRSVVVFDSLERLRAVNTSLWTYSTMAFLPHGCGDDPKETHSMQPIWLSTKIENPNNSKILLLTDGNYVDNFNSFNKCLDVFSNDHENSLLSAKNRMERYLELGFKVSFWKENLQGVWEAHKNI